MTHSNVPVSIPSLTSESGLRRYLQEIRKFPMLTEEQEFMLAKRWQEHEDTGAAHQLVTSHLRLVAKIAMQYRGYGLPAGELISEGNIGLMQAVKRFDPDKGFRLATYAMWWIKASMQEYVLKSWSLVKIGTSAVQKRLFFNLRKLKRRLLNHPDGQLSPDQVNEIAHTLDVDPQEVRDMDQRLSGSDQYLNAKIGHDGNDEWIDHLADTTPNQEARLMEADEASDRHMMLEQAMEKLTPREQDIIRARKLKEEPETLEELSRQLNISRERVRQIEVRAMEKLQKEMLASAAGNAA